MEQNKERTVYTGVPNIKKGVRAMKKYVPPKTGLIISPERKAEFFNGLALYMSEYKRKMQRKTGIPARRAS